MSSYITESANEYEYHINDDGSVSLDRYIGNEENVKIPEMINGKNVSEIGEEAFANNRCIKNIYLPDTIKIIKNRAFFRCANIENIRFGENLRQIGTESFAQCISLKHILINAVLEYLGEKAFVLSGITAVEILEVIECKEQCFALCSNLRHVSMRKCTRIKDRAFNHDIRLMSVLCEQEIQDISETAFHDCRLFETVCFQKWESQLQEYKIDVGDSEGNKHKPHEKNDNNDKVAKDVDNTGDQETQNILLNKNQLNKGQFEELLECKKLPSYIKACNLLINCELPESLQEMYNKLIECMRVLQASIDKFNEVYQPDMDQFYEYYIPEALQLTETYVEHMNVGISEDALEETKETVINAISGLITAIGDKTNEIYKFASMKIKAEAKALESIMNLDGYVDSEFKIK